jgi:IclR family acetate operon transcriptional repressor
METNTELNETKPAVEPDLFELEKKPIMVKSIDRAAIILHCISDGINTVSDIAAHCRLGKSTVHRLLNALREAGLVMRDPVNRDYLFGDLLSRLVTNPRMTHEYLVRAAAREMAFLADYTKEAVSLGVKSGINFIGLASLPSAHALRVVDDTNFHGDLYAGASGRVLLSQLGSAEVQRVAQFFQAEFAEGPNRFNEARFLEDIDRIREQGYAVSGGERVYGAMCIAAPVRYYHVPAALSILGPESRLTPHTREYLDLLLAAANRIGQRVRETRKLT